MRDKNAGVRKALDRLEHDGEIDVRGELKVESRLRSWGKWCRIGNGSKLGYAKRTLEGRLLEGELVGIKGSGEYRPPSDLEAEEVETAVSKLGEQYPALAFVLRGRFSHRVSRQEMAVDLSRLCGGKVSVGAVKKMEDQAIAWMDGRLVNE